VTLDILTKRDIAQVREFQDFLQGLSTDEVRFVGGNGEVMRILAPVFRVLR